MTTPEINNHALAKFGKEFNDLTQQVIKGTPINFIAITRIYDDSTIILLQARQRLIRIYESLRH